jgi:ribose transport system substrate-binding protein
LGGKGKVAVIDFPEVESVILRTRGFSDELKEVKHNLEIVGTWTGKGSKDESFKVAQEILQAHPDLNGIFAINDPTALGAYAAIEIAQKANQIAIVGFDGQPEGKKAIKEGKIYADPIQFPDRIGRETVRTIIRYFEGEKVEPEILIPTKLYYKEDAEKDPSLQG